MEQETKEMTTKQANDSKNGDGDDVGSSDRKSSSCSSDNDNDSKNNPAKPQQSTIIQSANGVKIESKLNPAAKEFYPAHLLLQRCGQPNKSLSTLQAGTATEKQQQQQQNANTDNGENKRQIVEIECNKIKQQDNVEAKEEHGEEKVEAKENPILANNNITEVIENEISKSEHDRERDRDDVIPSNVKLETETKTPIAAEEPQKVLPPVECVGDMGDKVNNNNNSNDNSEQQQHLHKHEQEQNASNFITYMQHDTNCDDSKEQTPLANEQVTGLANADENHEKKPMQPRKITKLSMSGGKHTSVGSDKAMTRLSSVMGRTKRISESLHNLSSTFKSKMESRKSESSARALARSSTTIPKASVRMRKSTGSKTYLPDCNGQTRDGAKLSTSKDAISLRSTSSTEKNISSKTSLHLSGGGHSVQRNSSTTSTKTIDKPSTTLEASGAKMKKPPLPCKLPRETVASALRQSEAQKRRNLFPNDDPDSNIELSQFLFK